MAYRVVYGPMPKAAPKGRSLPRVRVLTAAWLLVFSLGVRQLWPEGREVLRQLLLPGEQTAAQTAFDGMLEELRAGETLGEAVTAFCRQIVQDELQNGA